MPWRWSGMALLLDNPNSHTWDRAAHPPPLQHLGQRLPSQLGIGRDCLGKVVGRRVVPWGKGNWAAEESQHGERQGRSSWHRERHLRGAGIEASGKGASLRRVSVRKPSVMDGKRAWMQGTSCDSAMGKGSCSYWGFYDSPVSLRHFFILVQKYYGIMNLDFYSCFNLLIKDYCREKSCLFCVETLHNIFSHCKTLLIRDLLAQKSVGPFCCFWFQLQLRQSLFGYLQAMVCGTRQITSQKTTQAIQRPGPIWIVWGEDQWEFWNH